MARPVWSLNQAARVAALGLATSFLACAPSAEKGPDEDPDLSGKTDAISKAAALKGEIRPGVPVVATFDDKSHHLYEIRLAAGDTIAVTLRGEDDAELDTVLRIYGPKTSSGAFDGARLAYNDDANGKRSSRIESFSRGQGGTYAIVASTYDGEPATGLRYRLEVTCTGGSCAGDGKPDTPPPGGCVPAEKGTWTVLIYGALDCGESLPSLRADLAKRIKGKLGSSVRLLMLEDLGGGGQNSKIFLIDAEGAKVVKDLGEVHTGDPQTLLNFIKLGTACYPAEKYALDVIGHSVSALDGGLVDYYPGSRRYMHWDQFRGVLEDGGVNWDVLAVSVCMSSNLELAYELRKNARYLVGYESFSQGYTAAGWADALVKTAGLEPLTLAKRMVSSMASEGSKYLPQSVSAIDLTKIEAVTAAVDQLAPILTSALATEGKKLAQARLDAQATVTDKSFTAMVDLIDWIDQTYLATSNASLQSALNLLRAAVESAVVSHSVEVPWGIDNPHDRATGMGIAFPTPGNPMGRFTGTDLFSQLKGLLVYRQTQLDEIFKAYYPHF